MNEPFAHHRAVQRVVAILRDGASPDAGGDRPTPDASPRRPRLTPRQWEVLHGVAAGETNHQIGHRLGLSEATVRKHLEHIFERLQVSSRTEAVMVVSDHLHRERSETGPARAADLPSRADPTSPAGPSRRSGVRASSSGVQGVGT